MPLATASHSMWSPGGTARRSPGRAATRRSRTCVAPRFTRSRPRANEGMNREQRRHPEKAESPRDNAPKHPPEEELVDASRRPDDLSVRAKSTGHGKKTADKWNQ